MSIDQKVIGSAASVAARNKMTTPIPASQVVQQQPNSQTPYGSANTFPNFIARSTRPQKEEAIVLDSIDGLTNDDYLDGLDKLTDLNNARYILKISGGRVCIYLNDKNQILDVSTDSTTCFKCNQTGHIAKSCPSNLISSNEANSFKITTNDMTPGLQNNMPAQNNLTMVPNTTNKRPLSTTREDSRKYPINETPLPEKTATEKDEIGYHSDSTNTNNFQIVKSSKGKRRKVKKSTTTIIPSI